MKLQLLVFSWSLTLYLISSPVLPTPGESYSPAAAVRLSIKPVRTGDAHWVLDVKLTNGGMQPITVDSSALPWAYQSSILLVPVEARNEGQILEQRRAISDPENHEVVIKPGVTLSGRIELRDRILDLPKLLRRTGLVVFWVYILRTVAAAEGPVLHGSVLIPREMEGPSR